MITVIKSRAVGGFQDLGPMGRVQGFNKMEMAGRERKVRQRNGYLKETGGPAGLLGAHNWVYTE